MDETTTLEELIEMAAHRIVEADENNEDCATIQYWVGYLDALARVSKMTKSP